MRYDNWDIILFPESSKIPIPEYKTACYLSRDENGHELPTLRTYIGSLKPETPFRISVHHWGPPKPSPFLQQLQRTTGSDVTFTVQVIIDGARLYHGDFAINSVSPQEIAYEQRSFRSSKSKEQPTSQPKQRLLFPQSDKNALLQSTAWQPRGTDNRIKIILSERFVNENGSLETDSWDIVCFSFQHAHRELLEQAGIAYPIIDPLRILVGDRATFAAQCSSRNTTSCDLKQASPRRARRLSESDSELATPTNPEPYQDPPTRMPSVAMYRPQFMGHRGGGPPGVWHDSYRPFVDDDTSIGSWPSQRYPSNMTGLEGFYGPALHPYAAHPWSHGAGALEGQNSGQHLHSKPRRKDGRAQQVMMALREDQFGQILEAISPSKRQRGTLSAFQQRSQHADNQTHRLPKMGALSVPVRPASAATGRPTAYSELETASRNNVKRPSSDQATFGAHALSRNNKLRTVHPVDDEPRQARATMHNPFLNESQWDSDVSMRDGSSNFSSLSKFENNAACLSKKIGSAHAPSAGGELRGRKEGLAADANVSFGLGSQPDEELLPTPGASSLLRLQPVGIASKSTSQNRPLDQCSGIPDHVEIIDVDSIDPSLVAEPAVEMTELSPFKPVHKAGMSSISSTGRLERQLYSALGEELGSFEQQMDTTDMGPELAQALSGTGQHSDRSGKTLHDPALSESEPVSKRKRQGTIDGERDASPSKKKDRSRKTTVEDDDIPEDMPRMRGD